MKWAIILTLNQSFFSFNPYTLHDFGVKIKNLKISKMLAILNNKFLLKTPQPLHTEVLPAYEDTNE